MDAVDEQSCPPLGLREPACGVSPVQRRYAAAKQSAEAGLDVRVHHPRVGERDHSCLVYRGVQGRGGNPNILEGPFSAVLTPNFVSEASLCSIFQGVLNWLAFAPLQTQHVAVFPNFFVSYDIIIVHVQCSSGGVESAPGPRSTPCIASAVAVQPGAISPAYALSTM